MKKFKRGEKKAATHDITRFKKHHQPERDWSILLIGFFMMLLGAAAGSYYMFSNFVGDRALTVSVDPESVRTLDVEELKRTVQEFEERKSAYEGMRTAEVDIVDPSL